MTPSFQHDSSTLDAMHRTLKPGNTLCPQHVLSVMYRMCCNAVPEQRLEQFADAVIEHAEFECRAAKRGAARKARVFDLRKEIERRRLACDRFRHDAACDTRQRHTVPRKTLH